MDDTWQNLIAMNALMDGVIQDANIPSSDIPNVDLMQSTDFEAISAMLLSKLALIESCCSAEAIENQKKYDARKIRDKISIKKKQIAELEIENTKLADEVKKNDKIINQPDIKTSDFVDDQQTLLKLRIDLQAAKNEIKVLEDKRKGLLKDSNITASVDLSDDQAAQDETLTQEQEQEIENQREHEKRIYLRRMAAFKTQTEELNRIKQNLEKEIAEKNDQLTAIHNAKNKRSHKK